jgi:hypothetical protein
VNWKEHVRKLSWYNLKENNSKNSQAPGQYLNPGPPEHEVGVINHFMTFHGSILHILAKSSVKAYHILLLRRKTNFYKLTQGNDFTEHCMCM